MNRSLSISETLTAKRVKTRHWDRPIALWALIFLLTAIACTVLALDATLTREQRIAVFEQSGVFP